MTKYFGFLRLRHLGLFPLLGDLIDEANVEFDRVCCWGEDDSLLFFRLELGKHVEKSLLVTLNPLSL